MPYDALLLVSFGGPEHNDEVIPFLENVLRGRNVPRERMLEVAEHYYHFGGRSPINDQNRALIAALRQEMDAHGMKLPIYWGNRNWHPFLSEALDKMRADGIQNALAFMTSAYSSYSGCRQYREDVARAQAEIGEGAPRVDKLRVFYNHPGFVEAMMDRVKAARATLPAAGEVLFTAHSIPLSMAQTSDYEAQLRDACALVADAADIASWRLVYQSRSGSPSQPWLEPDVNGVLEQMRAGSSVIIAPIGFISDHMEVLYDLDTEAREICRQRGIHMARAETVGAHPKFISMIRELICERMSDCPKRSLGIRGPNHDVCPQNCCPAPPQRGAGPK